MKFSLLENLDIRCQKLLIERNDQLPNLNLMYNIIVVTAKQTTPSGLVIDKSLVLVLIGY